MASSPVKNIKALRHVVPTGNPVPHRKKKVEKKMDPFGLEKRFFSAGSRRKLASKGDALPDGSFPIKNTKDLANAKRLVGHSKHPEAARKLIARREAALSKAFNTGNGQAPGRSSGKLVPVKWKPGSARSLTASNPATTWGSAAAPTKATSGKYQPVTRTAGGPSALQATGVHKRNDPFNLSKAKKAKLRHFSASDLMSGYKKTQKGATVSSAPMSKRNDPFNISKLSQGKKDAITVGAGTGAAVAGLKAAPKLLTGANRAYMKGNVSSAKRLLGGSVAASGIGGAGAGVAAGTLASMPFRRNKVSKKAKKCPTCGRPYPTDNTGSDGSDG